jgi:hypothetical protein
MQCTASPPPESITPLSVSPRSLAAAFRAASAPRRTASVAYTLPAILTLAVAAILANHLSVLAIAEWGARQSPDVWRLLGFPQGRTPCQSTVQRLFRKLDGHALSTALSRHFAPVPVSVPSRNEETVHGVAVDGKAQRGRLPFQVGGCPVHALSGSPRTLGQRPSYDKLIAGG